MTTPKRKPKQRKPRIFRPTISQPTRLRKYSDEHVAYEVEMLRNAAAYSLVQIPPPYIPVTGFFSNSRTEAFALHLRNLIEFLFPDRWWQRDDVKAHHFLASRSAYADWIKVRPRLSALLTKAKGRADVEVAHLTKHRKAGTPPPKYWNADVLLPELDKVLTVFAAQADPERLGARARATIEWFSSWIAENYAGGEAITVIGTFTTSSTTVVGGSLATTFPKGP